MEQNIIVQSVPKEEQEEFKEVLGLRNLSPKTIKLYTYYYSKLGGSDNFSQEQINFFVKKKKNCSIVRSFINNFKEFLTKKFPDNKQYSNVYLEKISGRSFRKLPKYITKQELLRIEHSLNNERYKIMLLLCFYSALRVSELIEIRPYDFNWDRWEDNKTIPGILKVKKGKGNKERIVLIPSWLMIRIHNWIVQESKTFSDSTKRLFRMGVRRFERIINDHSLKAINTRISPHTLRHSSATYYLNQGLKLEEVKELLGHESISTTQIYTHIARQDLEDHYQKFIG
jgi:integrase/recombinase XerD